MCFDSSSCKFFSEIESSSISAKFALGFLVKFTLFSVFVTFYFIEESSYLPLIVYALAEVDIHLSDLD